jgi:hypothetical protein
MADMSNKENRFNRYWYFMRNFYRVLGDVGSKGSRLIFMRKQEQQIGIELSFSIRSPIFKFPLNLKLKSI